ncbi:hypothetical protein ACHAWF_004907 [Thalassiosira exigua]
MKNSTERRRLGRVRTARFRSRPPSAHPSGATHKRAASSSLPQQVDRDLQIRHPVRLRRRHLPVPQVHLQRRDDQLRHPELAISVAPPLREFVSARLVFQLLVLPLLLPDGRLKQQLPPSRLVVVSHVHPRLVRKLVVQTSHGRVQVRAAPAREVAPGRAEVGHEDGVPGEDGVAEDVADAGGGVAGGVEDAAFYFAQSECVPVFKQEVELAPVGREVVFGAVEDLAEGLLDFGHVRADAGSGGGVFLLQVFGAGQVIGFRFFAGATIDDALGDERTREDGGGKSNRSQPTVDVAFQDVPHVEPVGVAVVRDRLAVDVRRPAGGGVVIEDGVEDQSPLRGRVRDDVGHRGSALVEEAADVGFGRGHVGDGSTVREEGRRGGTERIARSRGRRRRRRRCARAGVRGGESDEVIISL